jgi:hypothetical protein
MLALTMQNVEIPPILELNTEPRDRGRGPRGPGAGGTWGTVGHGD